MSIYLVFCWRFHNKIKASQSILILSYISCFQIVNNLDHNKMSSPQQEQHSPEPSTYPVYSREFILRSSVVLDHSNKSKKQMQDFLSAFNKRIDAELTYQKNLNECAKILQKYIDPNTEKCISYISSAFKVDNEQRGNQAKQLADSLRTQVIEPMKQSFNKFTNLTKKAEKSFKKLNKDYTYFLQNYRRAKQSFNEHDNETKQMIITKNIYKYTSQYSQEKKNKMITKTMQSIRQKMEYQKLYKSAVSQLNQIIEIYQKDAVQLLNQLQLAEREQIKLESDGIRKLIVCEVSMFKNVQYDLINISKQMEKMYAENDIQEFKKEAITSLVEDDKDKQLKQMTLKAIELDKSLLSLSLKNVEEDYNNWFLGIKKNKSIRKVMELRMKELNPQFDVKKSMTEAVQEENKSQAKKQEVETIKEVVDVNNKQQQPQNEENITYKEWQTLPKQFFNPPPNPNGVYQKFTLQQSFQDYLQLTELINKVWVNSETLEGQLLTKFIQFLEKSHFLRILAYLFVEEYRIQHRVLMKWEHYQKALGIAKAIIDSCDKFGDVFVLKGLLALLFTFYSIKDEKIKKLMYQNPIIGQCEIWKKQDYWQASIFQSTYEQMVNFSIQKGETHSQTLLREKNIIFSQLASYCHYMLMLNVSSKNVRRIVGRYCRLYEMTEDQNKDLSKMISNTAKQIKQLKEASNTSSNNTTNNNNSNNSQSEKATSTISESNSQP